MKKKNTSNSVFLPMVPETFGRVRDLAREKHVSVDTMVARLIRLALRRRLGARP